MKQSAKHAAVYTLQLVAIAIMFLAGADEKMAEHGYLGQFAFWAVIIGLAVVAYESFKASFGAGE